MRNGGFMVTASLRRSITLVVCAITSTLTLPSLRADSVTVSGTTQFSALDGSAADHDGVVDGSFTVNDGDLTIAGTIACNDDPPLSAHASACPMRFVVSGNVTMQPGSALYAENRRGAGNGGAIIIEAGGNIVLAGATGAIPGAVISSSRMTTTNAMGNAAGAIQLAAGDGIDVGPGSSVAANALNATAGAVNFHAEGQVLIAGLVTSGPTSTVLGTYLT